MLALQSTRDDGSGVYLYTDHVSASPATSDYIFALVNRGKDSAGNVQDYSQLAVLITSPTSTAETASIEWSLYNAGSWNTALTLSGPGVLSVDLGGTGTAAQVDLFDDYDDALMLRQGIQKNNRELLVNMGVATRKENGSGYMMNLQPMVRLLAGGVYQTRQMLEDVRNELLTRLELIETKLSKVGLN